ncbi:hypothetical protein [Nocardia brasiliensis]|uniref:hypothetical protein n=1 Tax=Nocardia brasiliensis TaxID=37326 RepID=UPI002453E6C0|nr:hypothetical protein [Nocardia brasiliensis]
MTTPNYAMRTVKEWTEKGALEFKRSLITGELADRVRERFGVKHSRVYFLEYQEEAGDCHTCYRISDVLVVECGGHRKVFNADGGLPLNELLDWFDEPRRRAEAEAAKQAAAVARREQDAVFTARVLSPIGDALSAVENEGYENPQDWHDKLMSRLGVRGYRS